MTHINVSFIGSGRVATQLSRALFEKNIKIKQIFSRNILHAKQLAETVLAEAIKDFSLLEQVDIIFITVSDAAIDIVAQQLQQVNYTGLVVHTSGSTHLNRLSQYALRSGVFYPLQTFSFEYAVDWSKVPIFIEAGTEQDRITLENIANQLSSAIYCYDSEQRLSLHLAAVFACNFSNYCYDIAQQILQNSKVDTDLLQPLILETANKLNFFSAFQNQTGPAKRNDNHILALHESMLQSQQDWAQIYHIMSKNIQNRHSG